MKGYSFLTELQSDEPTEKLAGFENAAGFLYDESRLENGTLQKCGKGGFLNDQ
jgi:hypothetical protein